jgi:hypothetical protein
MVELASCDVLPGRIGRRAAASSIVISGATGHSYGEKGGARRERNAPPPRLPRALPGRGSRLSAFRRADELKTRISGELLMFALTFNRHLVDRVLFKPLTVGCTDFMLVTSKLNSLLAKKIDTAREQV